MQSPLNELKTNFKVTFTNPIGKYFTLFHFISNFSLALINGGIIYYLKSTLKLSDFNLGIAIGISTLGSVIGSLISPVLMKKYPNGNLFLYTGIALSFSLLSFMFINSVASFVLIQFITNFFISIIVIITFTLRQKKIKLNILARVISVSQPFSFISVPIAGIFSGWVLSINHNIAFLSIPAFIFLFSFSTRGFFDKSFKNIANEK